MPKRLFVVMLTIATLALGTGVGTLASNASETPLSLIVFGSGNMTGNADRSPGGAWITGQEQFAAMVDRLQQGQLMTKSVQVPEIDFNAYNVLVVWMGQKNTGGYALKLMADHADIDDDGAKVPIRWIKPQKGQLVSQMISHPFLIVKIAKETYDTITIIDQNGLEKVVLDKKQKE